MIVHKFGGTSLADAERVRAAAELVRDSGPRPVVVVSALEGVTDRLVQVAAALSSGSAVEGGAGLSDIRERHLETARTLIGGPDARSALEDDLDTAVKGVQDRVSEAPRGDASQVGDELIALGEDLSALLMAATLEDLGLAARVVDARGVVRTDDRFGGAVPRDRETAERVRRTLTPLVESSVVPVLQGFVGATDDGRTTTLGRGGSDFTAAIVAAALGAGDAAIWTDVDGVLSADPRQVPGARPLSELGYEEAVELAYFGARVIHPAAAKHAAARDVSLRIRNAGNPGAPGTLLRHDRPRAAGVAAIAHKPAIALIKVRSRPLFMAYGFLARVFDVLARHRLPVDLVATSHTSTAFTIDESHGVDAVRRELAEFAEVDLVEELATVSVVGHGLLRRPGIAARVFAALGDTPVQLISQASDVCLSFLVSADDAPDAVRRLHRDLIESEEA